MLIARTTGIPGYLRDYDRTTFRHGTLQGLPVELFAGGAEELPPCYNHAFDTLVMINVIDMRDTPLQIQGVEPGETNDEVIAKYQTPFLGRAALSAAHPVLMGFAAAPAVDIWGIEGADHWDRGGLVRYRSRRDLMKQVEAIREGGGDDVHAFKVAAIEKTIAYPLDPWFQLGDPRFVFALVFAVIGLSAKAFSKSDGEA